jgi:hypothetical protein
MQDILCAIVLPFFLVYVSATTRRAAVTGRECLETAAGLAARSCK